MGNVKIEIETTNSTGQKTSIRITVEGDSGDVKIASPKPIIESKDINTKINDIVKGPKGLDINDYVRYSAEPEMASAITTQVPPEPIKYNGGMVSLDQLNSL